VLKGLEPVKQRPGMYTRTDNPLHVMQEVLDNAADEALAGTASASGSRCTPTARSASRTTAAASPSACTPKKRRRSSRLVFTRLHAGGKFDKGKGGAYSFSGGLHGVGVSVTNALSKRLEVTSYREGQVATHRVLGRRRRRKADLRKAGEGDRKHRHHRARLARRQVLRDRGAAHGRAGAPAAQQGRADAGRHRHADQREEEDTQTWQYKGGLRDYLMQTLTGDPVIPLFEGEGYADSNDNFAEGEGAPGAWPSPKTASRCARATST
jgi:topoisomerase-4 subunit B